MKIIFTIFILFLFYFARSTIYEDCSKPENLRKQLTTEERIKRDQPQKLTKEEIEEDEKLEKVYMTFSSLKQIRVKLL